MKLCDALEYAHHYTIHRDVKPENIWIGKDGAIKLMDFGLAGLVLDNDTSQAGLSRSGLSLGTPYYMAPEQLKGNGDIDLRADQYSLAVLFYELLTGEVVAGMAGPANRIRKDLRESLSRVISKGLSASPEGRYRTIRAFDSAVRRGGDPLFWMPKTHVQFL